MQTHFVNPVAGPLSKLTETQLLDKLDPSVHDRVLASAAKYQDCEALVLFENIDMSSSELGRRSVLVVGPSNTRTLAQAVETHLGDVPSRFQFPVAYVDYRKNQEPQDAGS
jgi:hypothetical protein